MTGRLSHVPCLFMRQGLCKTVSQACADTLPVRDALACRSEYSTHVSDIACMAALLSEVPGANRRVSPAVLRPRCVVVEKSHERQPRRQMRRR